jgi:hypothetical protein
VETLHTVRAAIIEHVCKRMPHDPVTSNELLARVSLLLPPGSDAAYILSTMLIEMLEAGEIERFEDEERGTVYVRDC